MKARQWMTLLGGTLCWVIAQHAYAAPSLRVQVQQRGDFILIGNTLGYDCASGTPDPVVGDVGLCGLFTEDSSPDVLWRADPLLAEQARADILQVQARTTAVLSLPSGAAVTHAYLYWGATRASPGADPTITLDRPGSNGFNQTINAMQSYTSINNSYQSVVDISGIVQTHGSGAYRVSNLDVANIVNLDETRYIAWWMAVSYQRDSEPERNLALFDGLDTVSMGTPKPSRYPASWSPMRGFRASLASSPLRATILS